MEKEIRNLKAVFILFVVFMTVLFGVSLTKRIKAERDSAKDFAKIQANTSYTKDLSYRYWATMQGGVYVPVTENTQPDPYLAYLPQRDVVTTTGKKLTLINPASMSRRVYELSEMEAGIRTHITSLTPISSQNKADKWETKAMLRFKKGDLDFSSIEEINGKDCLRYMHSLRVEQKCLVCHANQGYKLGDIRGGISVSVPMEQYYKVAEAKIMVLALNHILVYLFILLSGIFTYRYYSKHLRMTLLMQKRISESEANLKLQNKEYALLNEEFKAQNLLLNLAKEKAEENELLFRTIFVEAPVGMALVNSINGRMYEVNPKFAQLMGRTIDEMEAIDWMTITHSEDIQADLDNLALLNAGEIKGYNMQKRYIKPDNSTVWINKTVAKAQDDKFGNPCHVSMIEDITKSKHAEDQLKNSREELKRYASHLQNVREEERIMLAREIHDDLAQNLVAVKVDLGLLRIKFLKEIDDAEDSDLMNGLTELSTKMNDTISTCRKIMSGLRSEELELIGLLETMKQFTKDFEVKSKIECLFQTEIETILLDPKESVTMLRIFQEALSNVYKHAKASTVNISLKTKNELLVCEIEDNGIGFNATNKIKNHSYGIIGMKERVLLLNGKLHVKSSINKGTIVRIEIPYSKTNLLSELSSDTV